MNKTFFLETDKLEYFLNNYTRSSIPLSYIEENGYIIEEKYYPRLDYIKIIEKWNVGD